MPDAVIIPVYLVTMAISGGPTFVRGLVKLFRLKFDIDSLMTIALVGR
ncbi:hypothetical protein [Cohnella faecalis]|nr:hypothetical protein [Cohnella faecalis]